MMGTNFRFFHDGPLFGLDVGYSSLKVMQMDMAHKETPRVIGYGVSDYYSRDTIERGEIKNIKLLAQKLNELFDKRLIGSISTKTVACTLPSSFTFSRTLRLPLMEKEHLAEAVRLEAEQYIPLPSDRLYIDYEVVHSDAEKTDLLVVACPKNIVDSYMQFFDIVGLVPVALEPTMNAASRIFAMADPSHDHPSLLIDFGSIATDIGVFDKVMTVNSTLAAGSDDMTSLIAKHLGVNQKQAYVLKNQHGISSYSDYKNEIGLAVEPLLEKLVSESRKILHYYEERNDRHQKVNQVILIGGGAVMPGLSEYLKNELGLPTRRLEPWNKVDFGELEPPADYAKSMYITVAGISALRTQEALV